MLQGQINISQGLSLNPLSGVHHQQRPFAGGQAPGYLIIEINVSRRIDQVQVVLLSIRRPVIEANRLGFDGYAPLPLQLHAVEDLVGHFPLGEGAGGLDKPIGNGGFAMVNMGDDRKISYIFILHLPIPSLLNFA